MSRSARHLLHSSGLRSGRAGGGRVGEDALAVLVGDDRRQRRFGRRSRHVGPLDARRRGGDARRRVVDRRHVVVAKTCSGASPSVACPRKTSRIACMFSPSSSGISTELPWIVVGRASIWYVVMAAGSTLLITPASSSILRVVRSRSVTTYWVSVLISALATDGSNAPLSSRRLTVRRRKSCWREMRPRSDVPSLCHTPSGVWYSRWRDRT